MNLSITKKVYMRFLLPVAAVGLPAIPPIGYSVLKLECVACTLRETNVQRVFGK
jgi:hypothetical protein